MAQQTKAADNGQLTLLGGTREERPTKSSFLNKADVQCSMNLSIDPRLGAVSRVMLAFNRRGLAIDDLRYSRNAQQSDLATIELKFVGSPEQIRFVRNDLLKIYDLVQLSAVLQDESTQRLGDRHEPQDLP